MPNKRPKILMVDDEQAIASTLATIFESQGYETATAFSGEEAVQVASSFHPDFIVSDVTMGAMNGIEAAMAILSVLPQCKVLFMSGNVAYLDLMGSAIARGFDFEFMQKPVPPHELLTIVSQVLSHPPSQTYCCRPNTTQS
jgi:CheY-like chemotaxis protein